jgi:hypothetical protein
VDLLRDFEIVVPPAIPPMEAEDDSAPLIDGEVVVYPAPRGRSVELRFAGPYEPFLTLDGERVRQASSPDRARLLEWMGRRLPSMYRELDHAYGLCACLTLRGVEVFDVVELETGDRLDHAGVRRQLADSDVLLPRLALLGPVGSLGELQARIRGMYASGTLLEVRREESGRTRGRRRVRVGR